MSQRSWSDVDGRDGKEVCETQWEESGLQPPIARPVWKGFAAVQVRDDGWRLAAGGGGGGLL